jgi:hypothetical protein
VYGVPLYNQSKTFYIWSFKALAGLTRLTWMLCSSCVGYLSEIGCTSTSFFRSNTALCNFWLLYPTQINIKILNAFYIRYWMTLLLGLLHRRYNQPFLENFSTVSAHFSKFNKTSWSRPVTGPLLIQDSKVQKDTNISTLSGIEPMFTVFVWLTPTTYVTQPLWLAIELTVYYQ